MVAEDPRMRTTSEGEDTAPLLSRRAFNIQQSMLRPPAAPQMWCFRRHPSMMFSGTITIRALVPSSPSRSCGFPGTANAAAAAASESCYCELPVVKMLIR